MAMAQPLSARELIARIEGAEESLRRSFTAGGLGAMVLNTTADASSLSAPAPAQQPPRPAEPRAAPARPRNDARAAPRAEPGDAGALLLIMSIDIGDGRLATLEIRERDRADALAAEFARAHGLGGGARETLRAHIAAQLAALEAEAAEARPTQPAQTQPPPLPRPPPLQTRQQIPDWQRARAEAEAADADTDADADADGRPYGDESDAYLDDDDVSRTAYGSSEPTSDSALSSCSSYSPPRPRPTRSAGAERAASAGGARGRRGAPPRGGGEDEDGAGGRDGDGRLHISRSTPRTAADDRARRSGGGRGWSPDGARGRGSAAAAASASLPLSWLEQSALRADAYGKRRDSAGVRRSTAARLEAAAAAARSPRRARSPGEPPVHERLQDAVAVRAAYVEAARARVAEERAAHLAHTRVRPPAASAAYLAERRAHEAAADGGAAGGGGGGDGGGARSAADVARAASERLFAQAARSHARLEAKRLEAQLRRAAQDAAACEPSPRRAASAGRASAAVAARPPPWEALEADRAQSQRERQAALAAAETARMRVCTFRPDPERRRSNQIAWDQIKRSAFAEDGGRARPRARSADPARGASARRWASASGPFDGLMDDAARRARRAKSEREATASEQRARERQYRGEAPRAAAFSHKREAHIRRLTSSRAASEQEVALLRLYLRQPIDRLTNQPFFTPEVNPGAPLGRARAEGGVFQALYDGALARSESQRAAVDDAAHHARERASARVRHRRSRLLVEAARARGLRPLFALLRRAAGAGADAGDEAAAGAEAGVDDADDAADDAQRLDLAAVDWAALGAVLERRGVPAALAADCRDLLAAAADEADEAGGGAAPRLIGLREFVATLAPRAREIANGRGNSAALRALLGVVGARAGGAERAPSAAEAADTELARLREARPPPSPERVARARASTDRLHAEHERRREKQRARRAEREMVELQGEATRARAAAGGRGEAEAGEEEGTGRQGRQAGRQAGGTDAQHGGRPSPQPLDPHPHCESRARSRARRVSAAPPPRARAGCTFAPLVDLASHRLTRARLAGESNAHVRLSSPRPAYKPPAGPGLEAGRPNARKRLSNGLAASPSRATTHRAPLPDASGARSPGRELSVARSHSPSANLSRQLARLMSPSAKCARAHACTPARLRARPPCAPACAPAAHRVRARERAVMPTPRSRDRWTAARAHSAHAALPRSLPPSLAFGPHARRRLPTSADRDPPLRSSSRARALPPRSAAAARAVSASRPARPLRMARSEQDDVHQISRATSSPARAAGRALGYAAAAAERSAGGPSLAARLQLAAASSSPVRRRESGAAAFATAGSPPPQPTPQPPGRLTAPPAGPLGAPSPDRADDGAGAGVRDVEDQFYRALALQLGTRP
jgi:hypothetical protein